MKREKPSKAERQKKYRDRKKRQGLCVEEGCNRLGRLLLTGKRSLRCRVHGRVLAELRKNYRRAKKEESMCIRAGCFAPAALSGERRLLHCERHRTRKARGYT